MLSDYDNFSQFGTSSLAVIVFSAGFDHRGKYFSISSSNGSCTFVTVYVVPVAILTLGFCSRKST